MTDALMAWHYAAGQWIEGTDPIREAGSDGEDDSVVLKRLGFERAYTIGEPSYGLSIEVFVRSTDPQFAICLCGDFDAHYVYATSLPEVWDLMARWAPVARDDSLIRLLDDFTTWEKGEIGAIETIARRAAWGMQQPYDMPKRRR